MRKRDVNRQKSKIKEFTLKKAWINCEGPQILTKVTFVPFMTSFKP